METKSRFYIVDTTDRPFEGHIAERRANGKFYYIHPRLINSRPYWGMTPRNPTPLEEFGIRVVLTGTELCGVLDPGLPQTAVYEDGRPRKWQGAEKFSFAFLSGKPVDTEMCPNCGGRMHGDGVTAVRRCEASDEGDYWYAEQDASPVYCRADAADPFCGPPVCCPYCKSLEIVLVCGWLGISSQDPDNTTELGEYQCAACNGRSFWLQPTTKHHMSKGKKRCSYCRCDLTSGNKNSIVKTDGGRFGDMLWIDCCDRCKSREEKKGKT